MRFIGGLNPNQAATGGGSTAGMGWNPGGMWVDEAANAANAQGSWAYKQQELANKGDLARQGLANQGQRDIAAINANASALPSWLQQDRFNKVFPFMQGQFNKTYDRVGGQSAPLPEITTGPVWNQQQIQQQVNAGVAANDRATQTAQKSAAEQTAGKGFGSQSPLLMALQQQAQMAGNAANSQVRREVPWQAAQGNAQQLLNSQVARQNQWAQAEDADIRRRQAVANQQSALLSALAGLV